MAQKLLSVEDLAGSRGDARLREILRKIRSTIYYESLYIHGSFATGKRTPSSDIDLIIIMKLPAMIFQVRKIRRLARLVKSNVDIKIISTVALRKFSPRLSMWWCDAVLLEGKNVLGSNSPSLRMIHKSAHYSDLLKDLMTTALNELVTHGTLDADADVVVPGKELEKMSRLMIQKSNIFTGVLKNWGKLGMKIGEEAEKPCPDIEKICGLLADYLDLAKKGIIYSYKDNLLYVVTVWIEKRILLWDALTDRTPVQSRFVESFLLYLHSFTRPSPDRRNTLLEGLRLLDAHKASLQFGNNDLCSLATQLREILNTSWRIAMHVPMGTFVLTNERRSFKLIYF